MVRIVQGRIVGGCPLPVQPASDRDISLAEAGDRMAKARLRMNAMRIKQREEQIAEWEESNGPAPWREFPDLLPDAGVVGARMVSPRGNRTRYVCVVVCPARAVYPRGHCIARMGLGRRGLSSRAL
tara:strand:- start:1101 stop:1478 length:378 start_codon:yes stop_codon:yes gene_type:complete